MTIVGLLAGGIGSRMGLNIPKQFVKIDGIPMIIRTIKSFIGLSEIDRIYVVAPQKWLEKTKQVIETYYNSCSDTIKIIEGGSTRNLSILKFIDTVKDDLNENHIDYNQVLLVTHDADRPFVSKNVIINHIELAKRIGHAGTAIPIYDTIIDSTDGQNIIDIFDQRPMFILQTPQSFTISKYETAKTRLTKEQLKKITDVCGFFLRAGEPACFSNGSIHNIKITTQYDLKIAESIARIFEYDGK